MLGIAACASTPATNEVARGPVSSTSAAAPVNASAVASTAASATAAPATASTDPAVNPPIQRDGWTVDGAAFGKHRGHIAVSATGVELLLSDGNGLDRETRGLADGSPWRSKYVDCHSSIGMFGGEFVETARGPAIITASGRSNDRAEVVLIVGGNCEEERANVCRAHNIDVTVVSGASKPTAIFNCDDDRLIAERGDAGWRTVATIPRALGRAAVEADGTIVVVGTDGDPGRWWTVTGGAVTEQPAKSGQWVDVRACGGKVYGLFFHTDTSTLDFGPRTNGAWAFQRALGWNAEDTFPGAELGFDDACRPILAVKSTVRQNPPAWTALPSPGGPIDDMAVHDGKLWVTFHEPSDDQFVGPLRVASRPLK